MSGYRHPCHRQSIEFEEKKSRFIAFADHIETAAAFKDFLSDLKAMYPDARHHCYGFRIGNINSAERGFSDDGEPSGTAGMPILNVLDHSEFSDIAIIVVRYFGGIKLGTGGLARAYSKAASLILDDLSYREFQAKKTIWIFCTFSQENLVRHLAGEVGAEIASVDYGSEVRLEVKIEESEKSVFEGYNFSVCDNAHAD